MSRESTLNYAFLIDVKRLAENLHILVKMCYKKELFNSALVVVVFKGTLKPPTSVRIHSLLCTGVP